MVLRRTANCDRASRLLDSYRLNIKDAVCLPDGCSAISVAHFSAPHIGKLNQPDRLFLLNPPYRQSANEAGGG